MANEDFRGNESEIESLEAPSAGGADATAAPLPGVPHKRAGIARILAFAALLTALYLLTPPLVAKAFALAKLDGGDAVGTRFMGSVYGPVRLLYYTVPPYRNFIEWQFQLLGMDPF